MSDSMIDISVATFCLLLFVIATTYLLYSKVLVPYREYTIYRDILTSNYKTKVNGFSILGAPMVRRSKKALDQYGDSQYYIKYEMRDYQVSLSMLCGGVFVDLIDP